jgi:hypothetical protein
MLRNNIYNIDREFNYATVKSIVVKALGKVAKEEALKKRANIPQNVIFDFKDNDYTTNVKLLAPPTPLLKLKIRNTTKYLNWRLLRLKRGNFTCQICHNSGVDDNDVAVLYQDPMKQNL